MVWNISATSPQSSDCSFALSSVRRVQLKVLGDLAFPAVAVREQLVLVVVELLARLGRIFEVRALDDGVDRASLLAEAAIDALDHVDVVARGAARAVVARLGFDGDGLRRADRLAQLAGDAAFLAVGIAAQRVLAAEARGQRPLLERIVQRRLLAEEIAHRQGKALQELPEEDRARGAVQECHHAPPWRTKITQAAVTRTHNSEVGRNTFHPSRISWS